MSLRVVDIADGYESETVPSVISVVGLRAVERVLTAGDIIAGKITLAISPVLPSTITLSWEGITQYLSNNDFAVSGDEIIFTGYNLQSLIQVGDIVRLTYQ
jgi:hypothetical protein